MIIAGTGHRPKFCPCKYNEKHPWLLQLREEISYKLNWQNHEGGIDAVVSGTAIGYDTWLAQEALKLKIPVWSYIPFKEQGSTWPSSSKKEYERILSLSEKVIYISEEYSNTAFFKRDRAMVDVSDLVYSLLNPESTSGGTYYTVQYAKSKNKSITNFWF